MTSASSPSQPAVDDTQAIRTPGRWNGLRRARRGDVAIALSAVALFVAIDGPGVAWSAASKLINGASIRKSTITSTQVKDKSLTGADVKDASLTGADIKDGSLTAGDISSATLNGARLVADSVGSAAIADGSLTAADLAPGTIPAFAIADGSITGAKLADFSVPGSKLAFGSVGLGVLGAGSVVSDSILDGSIATDDLGDTSVTNAKLAPNTITGAKVLDGSIGAADLAPGVVPTYTAGSGLTLTGSAFSLTTPGDARTLHVATSGARFTSVQAAIDSVTDATPTSPVVIEIGPGTFDGHVTLKNDVSLVGAGQQRTVLTSDGAATPALAATVTTANGSIRDMSIENTGVGGDGVGIRVPTAKFTLLQDADAYSDDGTSGSTGALVTGGTLQVQHATVGASGGGSTTVGIELQGAGSFAQVDDSAVSATNGVVGTGLDVSAGSADIRNSTVDAEFNSSGAFGIRAVTSTRILLEDSHVVASAPTVVGLQFEGAVANAAHDRIEVAGGATSAFGIQLASGTNTVHLDDSIVSVPATGTVGWLRKVATGGTAFFGNSRLEGGVTTAGGTTTTKCFGDYDAAYNVTTC